MEFITHFLKRIGKTIRLIYKQIIKNKQIIALIIMTLLIPIPFATESTLYLHHLVYAIVFI